MTTSSTLQEIQISPLLNTEIRKVVERRTKIAGTQVFHLPMVGNQYDREPHGNGSLSSENKS